MNKLYLFYPSSLIGFLITLVTRSPFAHAAIEVNGVLYDASETRGNFGRSKIDVSKRRHVCLPFHGDLRHWIQLLKGTKYDWLGVLGWMFKANDRNRFYCFEAAWLALRCAGVVRADSPYLGGRLSGSDLLTAVAKFGANHIHKGPVEWALDILTILKIDSRDDIASWLLRANGAQIARVIVEAAMVATGAGSAMELGQLLREQQWARIQAEENLYKSLADIEALALHPGGL